MIDRLTRTYPRRAGDQGDVESLVTREWIVTNGIGGYASGTIAGVMTRRYHGLLVSALPNPRGRTMMLNHLDERVTLPDGTVAQLGGEERVGGRLEVPSSKWLSEFRLEAGLPVWRYELGDTVLERRVVLPHRQNTVHVSYRIVGGAGRVRLELRPAVHFRSYESPVDSPVPERYELKVGEGRYSILSEDEFPALRLMVHGARAPFTADERRLDERLYRVEESRGYAFAGALWSPGCFTLELELEATAALIASTEPDEVLSALTPIAALRAERERRRRLLAALPDIARDETASHLALAADQFVITPAGRLADAARAWAVGDEVRTVIAGYHWFTDWGRDTMISLEGLTLTSGRHRDASSILRAFAHYVRDGLIPNMFPDGADEGLYHTADATLWFFHAVDRYLGVTGEAAMRRLLLPTLNEIIERHLEGTHFGIAADPADGLLRQGAEGYQLTWMDAKCDGWVVTPRRGKAVEINALWFNALSLMSRWMFQEHGADAARPFAEQAERARRAFNDRFWFAEGGYLYDVVDGPDGSSAECRPNQLFAISLPHPVLDEARWQPVLNVVEAKLLTPVGLRSLSPDSPDYKPTYHGDLRTRDAAYHQGTVWGWLIGPWVDAWLRVHPEDRAGARRFLGGLLAHLDEFGLGTMAEIFDAEPPFTPRGCIAQAWSVAECLRCWARTADPARPDAS